MLESFFDIRKDSRKLFEGLEITKNQALCDEWMNQYPTIFVSFRQVDGLNFTGAYDMLTMVIADLYNKHLYLLDSKSATEFQKTAFAHLAHGSGSIKEVKSSLMLLTTMIPQKTIRNEISAVQQELLLKLEIKSIAMLEYAPKQDSEAC